MEAPLDTTARWPLRTAIWLLVALASSLLLEHFHSPLVPLPGVATILLIPGATVMSALRTRPSITAGRIVLAVCLSLMVIMVVGGASSLLGPHVGLARPLDPIPEQVIWASIGVIILAVGAINRRDPATWVFEGVSSLNAVGVLVSGLLVLISVLGVSRLNHIGNSRLAVYGTILDVAVLLAGIIGGWNRRSRWPLATLLYAVTLAILLSTSLRGAHLYGSDIQQEFAVASHTLRAGVWVIPADHDPYSSMLSLTVLPVILHSLLRLRLTAFFELVVPTILSLLPVAVFSSLRSVPRWINAKRHIPRPGVALGVTAGLVLANVLLADLVGITRQAMALTMLAAIVMVLFDRSISSRRAQIVIGLLIISVSFTHYSTSYLLAAALFFAWVVGLIWQAGWLRSSQETLQETPERAESKKIVNYCLVVIALVAAFGWNLGVTRNNALSAPSRALGTSGIGLSVSTGTSIIPAPQMEKILVKEFHETAKWIVPVPGSSSVRLVTAHAPPSPGVFPGLAVWWNRLNLFTHESLWVFAGIALLYGLFYLGRRQVDGFSSDLAGLAIAGLMFGIAWRFSATLANYYDPERGAVVAAILLAAPITMLLDDISARLSAISSVAGVILVCLLATWATGLSDLAFGGQAPGSLVARGANVEQFTISTQELATAIWLRNNLTDSNVVQSDRYGELVLLSEVGKYKVVSEIVPPEVDKSSYVYLSTGNLIDGRSTAGVDGDQYVSVYRSNTSFFNRKFFIVYSTGFTRVYH